MRFNICVTAFSFIGDILWQIVSALNTLYFNAPAGVFLYRNKVERFICATFLDLSNKL